MKDTLAKLLATEDITVTQAAVQTASFDLKSRVLTIPLWKDMEEFTEDHLLGHEVGHALYTPFEEWKDAVRENGATFGSFLNVVEDARIEKKIQSRYPGLKTSFFKSYRKMLADDFFGGDIDYINTLKLIDRINCYFKLGQTAGVNFSEDEMSWVEKVDAVATFEEAIEVSIELFADAKAKEEKSMEAWENAMGDSSEDDEETEEDMADGDSFDSFMPDDSDGESGEESELNGSSSNSEEDGEETDSEMESESGSGSPQTGDEMDEDGEETSPTPGANGGLPDAFDESELGSITQENLDKAIRSEFNETEISDVVNMTKNKIDVDNHIISFKTILADAGENYFDSYRYYDSKSAEECATEDYKSLITRNKKTVDYMIKEFLMKRAASKYTRNRTAKTGVLDTLKMVHYKYNDDVFKKNTVTKNGKNHGMIMYLDWSGSMSGYLKDTIEQAVNMVNFCRGVGIPYRVYAFTSSWNGGYEEKHDFSGEVDHVALEQNFKLLEFFSDRMNNAQTAKMIKALMILGGSEWRVGNRKYLLGGTPLDHAIVTATAVFAKFKRETRADVVNTVFLTDGDSHSVYIKSVYVDSSGKPVERMKNVGGHWRSNDVFTYFSPITKRKYRFNTDNNRQITASWLKVYREETGSTTIGFRIMPSRKGAFCSTVNGMGINNVYDQNALLAEMKKQKYVELPKSGYDKYFAVPDNMKTEDGSFDIDDGASKAKITSAFKKATKGKLQSRAMLNKFIEMVA